MEEKGRINDWGLESEGPKEDVTSREVQKKGLRTKRRQQTGGKKKKEKQRRRDETDPERKKPPEGRLDWIWGWTTKQKLCALMVLFCADGGKSGRRGAKEARKIPLKAMRRQGRCYCPRTEKPTRSAKRKRDLKEVPYDKK